MKKISIAVLSLALATAHAQNANHWVGTWTTSPVVTTSTGTAVILGTMPYPAPAAAASTNAPTAAAPARPAPVRLGTSDITFRQIVHISLGGSQVRVVFTNEYGEDALKIGAASVQPVAASGTALQPLTFGGKPGIEVPPGAIAISDPVVLKTAPLSDLEVNLFLPAQTISRITRHTGALQTSYTEPGNTVASARSASATPIYSWSFLKSVDVLAPASAAAVVCFGDSITDGAYATRDKNARWPDDLARRLQADPRTKNLAVLDEGIGGNRVLRDNTGPSALARFNRDALDQAGVKYIILLEAINDIGHAHRTTPAPDEPITADDMIQGYMQLIERAHARGIKVIVATLTPYMGASYASPEGDKLRRDINQWIRTTKATDGMIDFDKATLDPAHPDTYLPAFDHGDHLHPSDEGLQSMANAIDISLFTK